MHDNSNQSWVFLFVFKMEIWLGPESSGPEVGVFLFS